MWEDMTDEERKAMIDCLSIFNKWAKRGRIMGQIKDKYGTTRWYAYLGTEITLNTIFYPRYMYNQMPKLTHWFDYKIFQPVVNFLFHQLFTEWQIYCYQQAYKECFEKYPQHNFHCIDHRELVDKYIPPAMWEQMLKEKDKRRQKTVIELVSDIKVVKDDPIELNKTLLEWERLFSDKRTV